MKNIKAVIRRSALLAAAVAVATGAALPSLLSSRVFAAGQVQSRSIQMSSSTPSASGVSYLVSFTPATTGAQSLVLDFCSDSAIIGATCGQVSGNIPDVSSASFSAGTGTANWSLGTHANGVVKLTKNTGSALGTSAITFTLTGITNPTTTGTFYARVYTYDCTDYGAHVGGGACSATGTAYSAANSIGSDIDYGGFALSTAAAINISATVMETITFCVAKTIGGQGCTSLGVAPALNLGHGSPKVLDSTLVDKDFVTTQISTNATHGAVVAMKDTSSAACAGLSRDGGTTCGIPAKAGGFGTMSAGTAAFGVNVTNGAAGSYGGLIGSGAANANYGPTANNYNMQAATFGTYGDPIFDTAGTVCANLENTLEFAATAAATTPAGVYSVTESLIATGTY